MPLLLIPSAPIHTPHGLLVTELYCIVNKVEFDRLSRTASFMLGYYVHEAASLPDSGFHQLPVNLPQGFSFSIQPAQANEAQSPQAVCEAYATYTLQQLLPEGSTIEEVA